MGLRQSKNNYDVSQEFPNPGEEQKQSTDSVRQTSHQDLKQDLPVTTEEKSPVTPTKTPETPEDSAEEHMDFQDPRSPGTEEVPRTPVTTLNDAGKENDDDDFVDPRSPSHNVQRTPMSEKPEKGSVESTPEPLKEKNIASDNLRRRAFAANREKIAAKVDSEDWIEDTAEKENAGNISDLEEELTQSYEKPENSPMPKSPKKGEMSLLSDQLQTMVLNSPVPQK